MQKDDYTNFLTFWRERAWEKWGRPGSMLWRLSCDCRIFSSTSYGAGEESWVLWTARRSTQSILKEINPDSSLERHMLKLKLQYFGHLMQRADSLENTQCQERSKAKGEWDGWGWDDLDSIIHSIDMNMNNSRRQWRTEEPGVL